MKLNYILFLILCLFAFASDQLSKFYITTILSMHEGEFRSVIDPILNWQYLKNFGINFGIGSHESPFTRWGITLITVGIVIFVTIMVFKNLTSKTAILGGLVIGGALGNIFDRITLGYVVDFINNSWYTFYNPFSYNLADVWIFVGLIGLLFWAPKNTD